MPTTKDQLNSMVGTIQGCLDVTRASGLRVATQLLAMAQLEIRLQAGAVSPEEFRQYCSRIDEAVNRMPAEASDRGQTVPRRQRSNRGAGAAFFNIRRSK